MIGNSRRIQVWKETQRLANERYPNLVPSTKVQYDPALPPPPKAEGGSVVAVVNTNTVSAVVQLKREGYKPVALNFSDDHSAGGIVQYGSAAQEESLFRQTTYFQTLLQDFYPLYTGQAVYSPAVTAFRHGQDEDWALMEHPEVVSLIAAPALCNPMLTSEGQFIPEDADAFRNKIRLVLQTAATQGHDAVVLGAWGCGVWGCPPQQVAQLFKDEVVGSGPYVGVFKRVVVSIIAPPPSGEWVMTRRPFEIFKAVFDAEEAAAALS